MTMTGKLALLGNGATQVTSTSEVNVVSILAQMGSRVITEVSNIMFEKFSQNFQALLQQSVDQPAYERAVATAEVKPPEPIDSGALAWQAVKGMFRNLLNALKGLFSAKA